MKNQVVQNETIQNEKLLDANFSFFAIQVQSIFQLLMYDRNHAENSLNFSILYIKLSKGQVLRGGVYWHWHLKLGFFGTLGHPSALYVRIVTQK